jgi:hypothetical protein
MIRFTVKANLKQTQNGIKFLKNIDRAVAKVSDIIIEEDGDKLIKELSKAPPPRQYPEDYPIRDNPGWTSPAQEKAFWASDGFGKGIPTERTNAMVDSWELFGETGANNKYSLIIRNTQDYAKFLVGSLAQQLSRAKRFQQKFHAWTGWELAQPKVQKWLKGYKKKFNDKLSAAYGQALKGQFDAAAYTSPRRKKRK